MPQPLHRACESHRIFRHTHQYQLVKVICSPCLSDERHYWEGKQNERHEIAHFDDVRAVNAIVELCGHQKVSVVATTDGLEQAEIHSLETISFSIGLLNGLTYQAFQIIARDTGGRIGIRRDHTGRTNHKVTQSVILFNGESYPKEAGATKKSAGATAAATGVDYTDEQVSFAIVVAHVLAQGRGCAHPADHLRRYRREWDGGCRRLSEQPLAGDPDVLRGFRQGSPAGQPCDPPEVLGRQGRVGATRADPVVLLPA